MPPRYRPHSSIGFFDVRARIYDTFVAEITIDGTRV
jgi:hypothetical protein